MRDHLKLLEKIRGIAKSTTPGDLANSNMAKYCCLLTCAAFEIGVKDLITEYVEKRSNPKIQKYVKSQLLRLNNPKPKIVESLLASFDVEWGSKFCVFIDLDGGKVRESLGTIVGQRNRIAHGQNSDFSFGRLTPCLVDVENALAFIQNDILGLQ